VIPSEMNSTRIAETFSAKAREFVEAVLSLKPQVATFDCDGTLWDGDAGEGFFDWELGQGFLSAEILQWARPRYTEYKAGKVSEEDMCGEMVTMHRGLGEEEVQRAAQRYFDEHTLSQIFPEMRDLVRRLQEQGSDVWAVSSTNEWVIRAAMRHFGIANEKILAAAVEIKAGRITDRLIRIPTGEGKPRAIRSAVGRNPDAAFGNSRWDSEMLRIALHPFAVNPNADLERIAREQAWTIYFPDSVRRD